MTEKFRDDRATDLFGHPVRANSGKPGRPPLQVDPQDRDMVEAALARGWSNQRIADALGISAASLKRYFRPALAKRDVMQDRLELAANATLIRAALEGGNMSAMKQLREMLDRDNLTKHKRKIEAQQQEADASGIGMARSTGSIGKKAAAQVEAEGAMQSDGWGDLLDPTRIN